MKIVKKDNKNNPFFIDTKEVKAKEIGILKNEIVLKILNSIKEKGKYPKQIAREIKVHEQNVYYYIKKLEKSKIIKIEKSKEINGTIANFYSLKNSSFFIKIKEFQKGKIKLEKVSKYFENFIENGELKFINNCWKSRASWKK